MAIGEEGHYNPADQGFLPDDDFPYLRDKFLDLLDPFIGN
jgi:hypothetical protein